jgi:hypothetical protein
MTWQSRGTRAPATRWGRGAGADVAASTPARSGAAGQAAIRGSNASVNCHNSDESWVWNAAPV